MEYKPKPIILIVDDDPVSGLILSEYLRPISYNVHFVDNAKKALKAVSKLNPDLILLDIMMPGMSGFEVCEALKNDGTTQDIPVLFITALSERSIHIKAIESGGDGFLVKPFNEDLVLAYVRTFLRMKAIHNEVKQRLASIEDSTNMTIHDLNNLNLVISGNLEVALLQHNQSADVNKYVAKALSALKTTNDMLENLQAIARLRSTGKKLDFTHVNLAGLINNAAGLLEKEIKSKDVRLNLQEINFIEVCGDRDLLTRIFINLIENAVKFAWPGTEIKLEANKKTEECKEYGECLEVIISNQCEPIPEKYHETIFEKFIQAPNGQERKTGKGLGLAFCKLAIELHGGKIWIESPLPGEESDVAVHFTLPGGVGRVGK